MRLRRVAVLGGGPGGLYVARLLRLADPACRGGCLRAGPARQTFGFGVGLAAGTQRNLGAADARLARRDHPAQPAARHAAAGRRPGRPDGQRQPPGIGRTTLLTVLQPQAAERRRRAALRRPASTVDDLDADLVIAADGVSSATRRKLCRRFGAQIDTGDGLYLWCGTDFALPSAVFSPVTHRATAPSSPTPIRTPPTAARS